MTTLLSYLDQYLLCINLLAYGLFWIEGRRVTRGTARLPLGLHVAASLLGGWAGSAMGLVTARTRTGDRRLTACVALAAVVWIGLICLLLASC